MAFENLSAKEGIQGRETPENISLFSVLEEKTAEKHPFLPFFSGIFS